MATEPKRITKAEALRRTLRGARVNPQSAYAEGALDGWRAAGYEIIEEARLPERLCRTHDDGVLLFAEPRCDGDDPIASAPDPAIAGEILVRWNARAKVLAEVAALEQCYPYRVGGPHLGLREVVARLRTVYGPESEQ